MTGTKSAAEMPQRGRVASSAGASPREPARSRGTGWVVFAALLLVLVGSFQVIQGFVALFREGTYAVGSDGLVVDVDYTVWGVLHLIVGSLAILIGIGLLTGNMVARGAAVMLATFSAVAALAFLPAQPAWSLIVITLDVLVIHAVVVHGGELERTA